MTQAIRQSRTHRAVRRYLDGLNALDPGLAVSAYAPNAVIRYPRPVAPMGVDAFRAYLEQVKLATRRLEHRAAGALRDGGRRSLEIAVELVDRIDGGRDAAGKFKLVEAHARPVRPAVSQEHR
jgi:hypothetical protein